VARSSSGLTLEGRLVMGMAMLFMGAAVAMVTPIQPRTITVAGGGSYSYEAKTYEVLESPIRVQILWTVFATIACIGLATTTLSLYGLIEPQMRAAITIKSVQSPANACPTCGQDLTLVKHYRRWYCWKCRKYQQPLVVCDEVPNQIAESDQ
jgi:ribosomal protein S27AE